MGLFKVICRMKSRIAGVMIWHLGKVDKRNRFDFESGPFSCKKRCAHCSKIR
jgi:hypothetical protein